MFCVKCGNNVEGSAFCHKCGTPAAATPPRAETVQGFQQSPSSIKSAEQQSIISLCVPMCILRFIDAVIWTFIVISQISWGFGFWFVIWNVIATGVSYIYAVSLLGICRSNTLNLPDVHVRVYENMKFSGICVAWYTAQILFWFASSIMFLALLIEVAILLLAFIAISRLSNVRQ